MVTVVYGGAATGKTELLLAKMKAELQKGVRSHWFMPEQCSLMAEKMICREIADTQKPLLETHSFRRFQEIVFEETVTFSSFGPVGPGKTVVMSIALRTAESELSVYKGNIYDCGFINELVKLYDEFRAYRTDPDEMLSAFDEENSQTADKLKDIKLIFSTYEALCGGEKTSREELAARLVTEKSLYKGDFFVFDGFDNFTPAETEIVKAVIKTSSETFFAFNTDTLTDETGGYGVFSDVISTIELLKAFCRDNGIEFKAIHAEKDLLPASFRNIERELFEVSKIKPQNNCQDIELYTVEDSYTEVSAAAAIIIEGLSKGLSYGDFTVMTPSSEQYRSRFEAVFGSSGIPYFDDSRHTVSKKPLCRFLLSVLEMSTFGPAPESLLSALKTGVTGAPERELSLFENYIYLWSLNTRQLSSLKPFTRDPLKAFSEDPSAHADLLSEINAFKRNYADPLIKLAASLKDALPRQKITLLYDFISKNSVPEKLLNNAETLRKSGRASLADEEASVYNAVVSLFDELYDVLPETDLPPRFFCDVFSNALKGLTSGVIPNSRDYVTVGEIGRSRNERRRIMIILGANDGCLPADTAESPILCDYDLSVMSSRGISAPPSSYEKSRRGRVDVLRALTGANEKLYVFRHAVDDTGKYSEPSYVYTDLLKMFPGTERRFDQDRLVVSRKLLYERFCRFDGAEESKRIKSALAADPSFAEFDKRLSSASKLGKKSVIGDKLAKSIYSSEISYSSLEKYRECAFSYFCRYGLKLRPREKFTVDAVSIGTFIHWCLENAMRDGYNGKSFDSLSADEIKALSESLSKQYVERFFSSAGEQSDRYNYLFERLASYLCEMLKESRAENAQSRFVPSDFELDISKGGDIEPLVISSKDGARAVLIGRVDRVDVMKSESGPYIRIIDYKTGDKKVKYSDIVNGLKLQLYIYLFAIVKNGADYYSGAPHPAGVVYRHSFGKPESVAFGGKAKESPIETSGVFINDREIVGAMDKDLCGRFIPVTLKTNGDFTAKSNLLSEDEFGEIDRYIEKKLSETVGEINSGNVTVSPFDGSESPCGYCDYKAVCGKIYESKRKPVKKLKADELLNIIREDESNG